MVEDENESKKALALLNQAHKDMKNEFDKRYDCEISNLVIAFHPLKVRFNIKRYGKLICDFSLIYLESTEKYQYTLNLNKDLTDKRDIETLEKVKGYVRFRLKFITIQ